MAVPVSRLPSLGHLTDRSADPRYMPTPENVYMNHPMVPMRMNYGPAVDARGHPVFYEQRPNPIPMPNHGRGYASHSVRTYDMESQ
ncbi:hypothetical protein N7492_004394 [Penicillium capsulatum]|uniref:Uncharacterized protein n=1 Tax=Penicillium capsulatum TaxID=69766 RepID=A0A9W9I7T4_9EURO|nr:hypothetical protein N7492_004394 [Penicillium capsulatum]